MFINSVELDNRIFAMQQKDLHPEVAQLVHQADVAYLQDREIDALILISQAEGLALELTSLINHVPCVVCGEPTITSTTGGKDIDGDKSVGVICRGCVTDLTGE